MTRQADIIIGAGASGLMAAIWAGRTDPARCIVVLDGATDLGAKILMSGGGRCNLTNRSIVPGDYAGSSGNAIGKVLRRFDVPRTIAFFRELGVEVTAGGVPLSALDLKTMEARARPGLHVCGEVCDVDGRIGGTNFQWAWSSGTTVGISV